MESNLQTLGIAKATPLPPLRPATAPVPVPIIEPPTITDIEVARACVGESVEKAAERIASYRVQFLQQDRREVASIVEGYKALARKPTSG